MKIIEITINAKGETTVQTKGFAGGSCRDASRFIEQALGQRVIVYCVFAGGPHRVARNKSDLLPGAFSQW